MSADTLPLAHRYLALGLSVIPVPRADGGRHDGKVPSLAWKPYQDRLPTDDELVPWFNREPMNLAIITGALSGIVVIDADEPAAVRWVVTHLPYTAWQVKTRRGFHFYYQYAGIRVPNRAKIETRDGTLALDVRGDGGYVIAAGSVHATGATYVEAGDWTVLKSALPRFWLGWLASPKRTPAPVARTTARPTGDMVTRARAYLAPIPRPEIGQGSDNAVLYAACRLTRGFALAPSDAEALLWDWAGGRPGWTREWIAVKVAAAQKYGREPIGLLR